ncbi:hypothetical protein ACLOJK_003296 [Asimina triloba]
MASITFHSLPSHQIASKNQIFSPNTALSPAISLPREEYRSPNGGKFRVMVRAQTATAPAQSKPGLVLDVVSEAELKEKGFLGLRKTKLVCTVGPACCSWEDLEVLAKGGMNVVRLNMCHNTREWHRDVIQKIKRLNEEKGYCISVMIDTEGSQTQMVDLGGASSVKAEILLESKSL